jgi:hypothetical protein
MPRPIHGSNRIDVLPMFGFVAKPEFKNRKDNKVHFPDDRDGNPVIRGST